MISELKKNANKIKKIIKDYLGTYDEDIEQEVYIRAWKNKDKYSEQNKFSSWICTITANICKDFLKNSKRKFNSQASRDEADLENIRTNKTPEITYSLKERQKIILKEINNLPKKMKQVIILYEYEDLSYEQISAKLNIPIGTVKSRINNARKILAENLKELLEDN